jgi:hypothetical protein
MSCDWITPNLQGNSTSIKCLDPLEVIKVVGAHQSPDGKITTQVRTLKDKVDALGEKITSSWLPWKILAHEGHDSMMWVSLKYPLPACKTSLSKKAPSLSESFIHNCSLKCGLFALTHLLTITPQHHFKA